MNGIMAVSLAGILAIVGSVTATSLQATELHHTLENNETELLSRGSNGRRLQRYNGGTGRREILSYYQAHQQVG